MSSEPGTRPKPSRRDRYRYVLFRLAAQDPPDRNGLIRLLQGAARPEWGVWLTRYDGELGILRVRRGHEVRLRTFLADLRAGGLRLEPLATSGTIAALERKHLRGRLRER